MYNRLVECICRSPPHPRVPALLQALRLPWPEPGPGAVGFDNSGHDLGVHLLKHCPDAILLQDETRRDGRVGVVSDSSDSVFEVLDCSVRILQQVLTHRFCVSDGAGTPHTLFRTVYVVFEEYEFVRPLIVAARENATNPIHRIHRHLLAVDIHRRACGRVELVPQRFHASAEIHDAAKSCAWRGVWTLDLILDFVEEDTNELELEDMLGGIAVGAALTSGLERPESKIVAVLSVSIAIRKSIVHNLKQSAHASQKEKECTDIEQRTRGIMDRSLHVHDA